MAAVAAPASKIRANEPIKTSNPSPGGGQASSIPADPDTRESSSEGSDPSSSGPQQADPKKTDPKAVDSKSYGTEKPNSNSAETQDIKASIPEPENNPAPALNPKPPNTETVDRQQGNSPPSDTQRIDSQVQKDHDTPDESQGSSPEFSKPDGRKTSSSSTDRSEPNVPDTPSIVVDSSNRKSEYPALNGDTASVSDSSGKDNPGTDSQGEEVTEPDAYNLDSFNSESKQATSKEKASAISLPDKLLAADPETNSDDISDVKAAGNELDLFDVPLTKLTNINEALSPSAKSGSGQYSTPNDPQRDPASQPQNNIISFPAGDNLDDEDGTAINSSQSSANTIPTTDSAAGVDTRRKSASADDSASAIVAAGISEKSGSARPSASIAASGLSAGKDGTSDSKYQGDSVDADVSDKTKSSGSSSLALKRHTDGHVLISARGILYGICIYMCCRGFYIFL